MARVHRSFAMFSGPSNLKPFSPSKIFANWAKRHEHRFELHAREHERGSDTSETCQLPETRTTKKPKTLLTRDTWFKHQWKIVESKHLVWYQKLSVYSNWDDLLNTGDTWQLKDCWPGSSRWWTKEDLWLKKTVICSIQKAAYTSKVVSGFLGKTTLLLTGFGPKQIQSLSVALKHRAF